MAALEVHAQVADPADVTDDLQGRLRERLVSRLRLNTRVAVEQRAAMPGYRTS